MDNNLNIHDFSVTGEILSDECSLAQERDEWKNKYLYALAEISNLKARFAKDAENLRIKVVLLYAGVIFLSLLGSIVVSSIGYMLFLLLSSVVMCAAWIIFPFAAFVVSFIWLFELLKK